MLEAARVHAFLMEFGIHASLKKKIVRVRVSRKVLDFIVLKFIRVNDFIQPVRFMALRKHFITNLLLYAPVA